MDINLLVQRLQHGESYTLFNDAGDPYQENRPPNTLSIKAAQIIVQQSQQLQQAGEIINNLQRQLNELAEQYELLQRTKATPEPNNSN